MGLNKDGARRKFITITDQQNSGGNGKLVLQHSNPIEGVTKERINKNGKTVHEEFFKSISGHITGIQSKDTPFGMVWEVEIADDDEVYVLSWNYSSRYTNHFFRALPNVDLTKVIKIEPWEAKDKQDPNKTATGLSLYQEGWEKGKVPFKYSRDEPGDMPEMEQIKRKGKTEWDDSKQLLFFEKMLEKKISLKGQPPVKSNVDETVGVDDLPF